MLRIHSSTGHSRHRELAYLGSKIMTAVAVIFFLANEGYAQTFGCIDDSIRSNSSGESLQMNSRRVFEPFADDQFIGSVWRPGSSVIICGPISFRYSGKRYSYYRMVRDGRDTSVNAWKNSGPHVPSGSCYESSIRQPSPFMGNSGENFTLHDGSVWEVGTDFNNLYEFYPSIIACPGKSFVIVDHNRIPARRMAR